MTQAAQPKYEYTVMDSVIQGFWGGRAEEQLEGWLANLNQLGDDGWDLVSDTIIYTEGRGATQRPVLLFKRQKL